MTAAVELEVGNRTVRISNPDRVYFPARGEAELDLARHDLDDLPDDRASELGLLVVRIAQAIESLPHIARAHVCRWGDGGAHLHVFFFARPAGFSQLRGTCLAIWDDLLPAVPSGQRDEDAAAIARAITASCGGRPH